MSKNEDKEIENEEETDVSLSETIREKIIPYKKSPGMYSFPPLLLLKNMKPVHELPKLKGKVGRPTKFNTETLNKLQEGFARGLNDHQACLYADVSQVAFIGYCKKNPTFIKRKELLKQNVRMMARLNISDMVAYGDINESHYTLDKTDEEYKPKENEGGMTLGRFETFETIKEEKKITAKRSLLQIAKRNK